jgi:hypothetical protein
MSDTSYKWRIYCETENAWVETSGTISPISCLNNAAHTVHTNTVQKIQSNPLEVVSTDTYTNQFGDDRVVERTTLFDLKSFFGISEYRNIVGTTGSATVTNNAGVDSEICIAVTGSNDIAQIRSAERGQYVAGSVCEAGVGIRIPSVVENQEVSFGYFDDTNGYFFKVLNNKLHCCVRNNGEDTIVHAQNFNIDKLNGLSKSGFNLDLAKGNIFHINFSWYGYGSVLFSIVGIHPVKNVQTVIPMHHYEPYGSTSTKIPNLPITVKVSNNNSTVPCVAFVGGRQFSVIGQYNPQKRYNMNYTYNKSINSSTATPLISVKKTQAYTAGRADINVIKINTTVDTLLTLTYNPTLTPTGSFTMPTNVSESGIITNTSSTEISGGTIVWSDICFAGEKKIELPEGMRYLSPSPLTLTAQSLGTTGTISAAMTMREFW